MPSALKLALEGLLRERALQREAPPLRGEDRRLLALATGVPVVDGLLGGGFPRGEVSEVHGPASSGRTALVLGAVGKVTASGALAAWVDPGDSLDPVSASAAGADLGRLLWLRGGGARGLSGAVAAVGTLLGSGLFDLVVLDLAGLPPRDVQGLPRATWIRLQRTVENTPGALLLLAESHVALGPGGAALALRPGELCWRGRPGPGRLFGGREAEVRAGRQGLRGATVSLLAPA